MRLSYLTLFFCLPLLAQITLEEFGTLGNTNITLQVQSQSTSSGGVPVSRFNPTEPPRTNDFQALQQTAAQNRETTRIGYFYVSQGPTGAGLTLPAFESNSTGGIDTPLNTLLITIGCVESNFLRQICSLPTTQTLLMNYSPYSNDPPTNSGFNTANQTFTDYNVRGA